MKHLLRLLESMEASGCENENFTDLITFAEATEMLHIVKQAIRSEFDKAARSDTTPPASTLN